MTPAPLVDRVGHVAGVESVVVDGRRWYFGFDYSSDLVVSPLIDDPGVMAEFAARHMAQTDGTHDTAYWAEQVDWANDNSDLAEPSDNVFSAGRLATGPDDILMYLLTCALGGDWDVSEDQELSSELDRLHVEHGWDGIDEALEKDDTGRVRRRLLDHFASHLPANWAAVFAPLFASGNEVPSKG